MTKRTMASVFQSLPLSSAWVMALQDLKRFGSFFSRHSKHASFCAHFHTSHLALALKSTQTKPPCPSLSVYTTQPGHSPKALFTPNRPELTQTQSRAKRMHNQARREGSEGWTSEEEGGQGKWGQAVQMWRLAVVSWANLVLMPCSQPIMLLWHNDRCPCIAVQHRATHGAWFIIQQRFKQAVRCFFRAGPSTETRACQKRSFLNFGSILFPLSGLYPHDMKIILFMNITSNRLCNSCLSDIC